MRPERFTWVEGDVELVSEGDEDTEEGVDADVDNDEATSEPEEE